MRNFIIVIFLLLALMCVKAQDVKIISSGYEINGTILIPPKTNHMDIVLIIAGSGPTDRNGNSRFTGNSNNLKMLSEILFKEGIASLRYDKRGIGSNNTVNESDLTFEMYIKDAIEWINYLKQNNRFSKVIVLGHSEGSLIGMVAARLGNADKFISLCGAGEPIYKTLEEQIINRDKIDSSLSFKFYKIIDSLKVGKTVSNIPPEFNTLFHRSVQPYLISWFKYNPCEEIAKLNIPILVIGGTTDIQVKPIDAELLFKSNKNAELEIIEDMNHILKEVPTLDRTINLDSYLNPELPLSYELCLKLRKFLKK